MIRSALKRVVCFVIVGVCSLPASSQAPVPSNEFTSEAEIASRIVVDLDIVNVYFNVRQNGKLISGLPKEEFTLLEDRHRQEIRYFYSESHAPLSLALMIDSSASQRRVLELEQEVGRRFLSQVLTPGDEAMVVGFDYYVQLRQDFTASIDDLLDALKNSAAGSSVRTFEFDPGPQPIQRSTALYDAVVGTTRARMAKRVGRKVLIILTDGQDKGSRNKAAAAIESAVKSNTICYVFLIGDKHYTAATDYTGSSRMQELVKETGGRIFKIDPKMEKLGDAFDEIALDLRHHYSIGYQSNDRRHDGRYRTIVLQSKHKFRIQARQGYYAPLPHKRERHEP